MTVNREKCGLQAVGDDLVDSIISDNIPVLSEQEKFNETAISSVQRIAAKLRGETVPEAPKRADTSRQRTYKTKVGRSSLLLAPHLDPSNWHATQISHACKMVHRQDYPRWLTSAHHLSLCRR